MIHPHSFWFILILPLALRVGSCDRHVTRSVKVTRWQRSWQVTAMWKAWRPKRRCAEAMNDAAVDSKQRGKGKPLRLYYGKSGVLPGSGAGKAWVVWTLRALGTYEKDPHHTRHGRFHSSFEAHDPTFHQIPIFLPTSGQMGWDHFCCVSPFFLIFLVLLVLFSPPRQFLCFCWLLGNYQSSASARGRTAT